MSGMSKKDSNILTNSRKRPEIVKNPSTFRRKPEMSFAKTEKLNKSPRWFDGFCFSICIEPNLHSTNSSHDLYQLIDFIMPTKPASLYMLKNM